jgi:hypothetical protein
MTLPLDRTGRIRLVVAVALAGVLASLVLPPLRQWQDYHQFADARTWLGVPNFWNVISNIGFLVVGSLGLSSLWKVSGAGTGARFSDPVERHCFVICFLGVTLTGFGSAYYHWHPTDATLVWDRLPMTVVFMAVLAVTVCERISIPAGQRLLWPLVAAGIASVIYWRWSGNLWPYAAAQYLSLVIIGLLLVLFPPRYTRSSDFVWIVGLYALAKVLEGLDARLFALGQLMSGHALKHLAAAGAVYWLVVMVARRRSLRSGHS